jgi:hypothetical protein
VRAIVAIDYWNFVLSLRKIFSLRYEIDWRQLTESVNLMKGQFPSLFELQLEMESVHFFGSFSSGRPEERDARAELEKLQLEAPGFRLFARDRIKRSGSEGVDSGLIPREIEVGLDVKLAIDVCMISASRS